MSSMTTQPSIADAADAIKPRQKRAALTVAMLGFADFVATAVLIGLAALLSLTLRGVQGARQS
jgi:hypothetical protein